MLAVLPTFVSSQEGYRPNLEGMWIEAFTTYADPRWSLEDLVCLLCSGEAVEYLPVLMEQEEGRSLTEMGRALDEFDNNHFYGLLTEEGRRIHDAAESHPDPRCEPIGAVQHMRGLLSFKFEEFEDRITLQYEYLGPTRTVYMDGRDHPADLEPSLLGHSIGWYDGPTLVVETIGLKPSIVRSTGGNEPLRVSESALVIERYTRNEGDDWFDYEVTLVDPRIYREPFVALKQRRLLEQNQEFEVYGCEVVSGEF